MNGWLERNQGYIISGGLQYWTHRPPSNDILIVLPTPTAPMTKVRVFVSGAVNAPDVYELPINSLVKDAIQAAGGESAKADLVQINLARQVKDQEQIFVPARVSGIGPQDRSQPSAILPGGKLNLNTVTNAELETLPGIGPGLAQRIIEYRADNGSFVSPEDIKNVSGIGDAIYDRIKDQITVN
jgi:competence protein ComEA